MVDGAKYCECGDFEDRVLVIAGSVDETLQGR